MFLIRGRVLMKRSPVIVIYGDQVLRPRHTMDIIDLDRDINKSKLYH